MSTSKKPLSTAWTPGTPIVAANDIGTTGVSAGLVTADARPAPIIWAGSPISMAVDQPPAQEQDPNDWLVALAQDLQCQAELRRVKISGDLRPQQQGIPVLCQHLLD